MNRKNKILYGFSMVTGAAIMFIFSLASDLRRDSNIDANFLRLIIILAAIAYVIAMICVPIIVIYNNKGIRKVKSYASRSKFLVGILGIPADLFEEKKKSDIKNEIIEARKEDARNDAKDAFYGTLIGIIVLAIIIIGVGIYYIFVRKEYNYIAPLIIGTIAIMVPLLALLLNFKASKNELEESFFDEEKVRELELYDIEDDSIEVSELKVYPTEVYIEITSNDKKTYVILEKKMMYLLTLDRIQIKQRDTLNTDVSEKKEVKREFRLLFKRTKKGSFETNKKSVDEILGIIKSFINE